MTLETSTHETESISRDCPRLKRIGLYGFMFHLIKGVLWLVVPGLIVYFGVNQGTFV